MRSNCSKKNKTFKRHIYILTWRFLFTYLQNSLDLLSAKLEKRSQDDTEGCCAGGTYTLEIFELMCNIIKSLDKRVHLSSWYISIGSFFTNCYASIWCIQELGSSFPIDNWLTVAPIFFLCWCCVLRWIWCLWCYSECISTPGKLEKYAWPRWESNLRPLEY